MKQQRALTWSYGGGIQSVAIAVLITLGKLPMPECTLIADTGREAQSTWGYMEEIVSPMLKAHGGGDIIIAPHELATVDLYAKNGDVLIPAYTENGKLPTFCSNEWKARVVRRMLVSLGYGPDKPVITWIGMSRDELGRLKPSGVDWQEYQWPLAWDLRLSRHNCEFIITSNGWPLPEKSSCWCCPHRKNSQWRYIRDNYQQDWKKAIKVDDQVFESHGVRLHESRLPLAEADLDQPDTPPIAVIWRSRWLRQWPMLGIGVQS